MSMLRSSCLIVSVAAALAFSTSPATQGQVTGGDAHDHRLFACLDDGLSRHGSTGFGCQLLAKYQVTHFSDMPLFWHVAKLPTRVAVDSRNGQTAFTVDAGGQVWLFSFGPKDAAPTQGEPVISVGPLPLTPGKSYQVVAYFVVMPVGAHTIVHTHPGPEAWYVLAGAQCLETPAGAMKLAAGEGGVAPPNTPMRLSNIGSTTRRALFIVIHDPMLPWGSPSDWGPPGACER